MNESPIKIDALLEPLKADELLLAKACIRGR